MRTPTINHCSPQRRRMAEFALISIFAGLLTVVPAATAQAIASRTVAFWSLDEPAGSTVAVDSSGNGRHGTIGADVTPGTIFAGAVGHRFATHLPAAQQEFPGHINRVPDAADLDPGSGDFSITVRLRTTYSFGNIMQKGQGGNPGGYWKLESPGGMPRCLFRGSNGSSRTGYTNTRITDGQWHTIRCNRTSSFVEMYVDGVRTSRLNGATGTIDNSTQLTMGGKGQCDGVQVTCDYFIGDIDYVRVEKGSGGTNVAPTADIQVTCSGVACSFSGTRSVDPDGAIQRYVWDFGDGHTFDGLASPTTSHIYAGPGIHTATLTVTDDRGATHTATATLTITPIPEIISFVDQVTANANSVDHQVVVPSTIQPGDTLLLFLSQNTQAASAGPTGGGWSTVQALSGGTARTTLWQRVAVATDPGSVIRLTLSAQSKGNLVLLAYRGVDPNSSVAAHLAATDTASSSTRTTPSLSVVPTNAWAISYWMHGDAVSTSLTPPSGVAARSNSSQTGGGRVTVLVADSNGSVPPGTYGGISATAAAASTTTTTWTVILRPAP